MYTTLTNYLDHLCQQQEKHRPVPTASTTTSQVPHNGSLGEYPLPRLTCQRLTADHHCSDPLVIVRSADSIKRSLSEPLGTRAGVAHKRHEHVVCGCATRAFGMPFGADGQCRRMGVEGVWDKLSSLGESLVEMSVMHGMRRGPLLPGYPGDRSGREREWCCGVGVLRRMQGKLVFGTLGGGRYTAWVGWMRF